MDLRSKSQDGKKNTTCYGRDRSGGWIEKEDV